MVTLGQRSRVLPQELMPASAVDLCISEPEASVQYRASHRSLFTCIDGDPTFASNPLALGLICVPTARSLSGPLPGLELAAQLAVDRDCPLLVLCSGAADPFDFPAELRVKLGRRLVLAHLNYGVSSSWWLPLKTQRLDLSWFVDSRDLRVETSDVGAKRNLALKLAAKLGLPTVLFVDDDIVACQAPLGQRRGSTLDSASVSHALATMADRPAIQAVGWSCEGSPESAVPAEREQLSYLADHSVLGHARRFVGKAQKTFIAGGALLVRVSERTPFFPSIYNEDWLFFIAMSSGGGKLSDTLARAGRVLQLCGHPFTAGRARAQEVGDTMGEVMMNLIEDCGNLRSAHRERFWQSAITERGRLIGEVRSKLAVQAAADDSLAADRAVPIKGWAAECVVRVLGESLDVNCTLRPERFTAYLAAFNQDLATWRVDLATLIATARPGEDPRFMARLVKHGPMAREIPAKYGSRSKSERQGAGKLVLGVGG